MILFRLLNIIIIIVVLRIVVIEGWCTMAVGQECIGLWIPSNHFGVPRPVVVGGQW